MKILFIENRIRIERQNRDLKIEPYNRSALADLLGKGDARLLSPKAMFKTQDFAIYTRLPALDQQISESTKLTYIPQDSKANGA